MVTHSSTSRPVQCLCMAERTGCPVFTDLWSYVLLKRLLLYIILTVEPSWFAMQLQIAPRLFLLRASWT